MAPVAAKGRWRMLPSMDLVEPSAALVSPARRGRLSVLRFPQLRIGASFYLMNSASMPFSGLATVCKPAGNALVSEHDTGLRRNLLEITSHAFGVDDIAGPTSCPAAKRVFRLGQSK